MSTQHKINEQKKIKNDDDTQCLGNSQYSVWYAAQIEIILE